MCKKCSYHFINTYNVHFFFLLVRTYKHIYRSTKDNYNHFGSFLRVFGHTSLSADRFLFVVSFGNNFSPQYTHEFTVSRHVSLAPRAKSNQNTDVHNFSSAIPPQLDPFFLLLLSFRHTLLHRPPWSLLHPIRSCMEFLQSDRNFACQKMPGIQ